MQPLDQNLKAKFFAAYFGVKCIPMHQGVYKVKPEHAKRKSHYLFLRHISMITDDEAKEILSILDEEDCYQDNIDGSLDMEGVKEFIEALFVEVPGMFINSYNAYQIAMFIDYLRSIGVAVTFSGYTVKELEEAGFLKLDWKGLPEDDY